MGKSGKKKEGVDINSAIEKGINTILKHHPRFNQEYILKHIDPEKLKGKITEIYENIGDRKWSDKKKLKYVHKELADYVADENAFDEAGKEIISRRGLEEKAKSGFLKGFSARGVLKKGEYLDQAYKFSQDLSALFKKGDCAQRMPEVVEANTTVQDMVLLDPAVDSLKHYGLIKEGEYHDWKKYITKTAEEGLKNVVSGIKKYATQPVAASLLGIFGLGLLILSGTKITGAVIGGFSNGTIGLLGGFFILVSLILFLRSFKKKRK